MQCIQLEFFETEEECEIKAMNLKIQAIDNSTNKVRKSLFAKNGELTKKILELEDRLLIIERNICKG